MLCLKKSVSMAEENLPNKGGSQLTLTSMCESKNTKTSPVAFLAPSNLVTINPFLSCKLMILTFFGKFSLTYFCSGSYSSGKELLSLTIIISCNSSGGVLLRIE